MTTIQSNIASQELMTAMNPAKSVAGQAKETQDRFMTLLVTQMKNQDPLNPLDNAQVTSQLAQLSTVTGIEKLNTTLEAMMTSFQSNQALQAASMIGHGVLTPGSSLALDDGKALLGFEMANPADQVQITIRDAGGKVVRTLDVGAREAGVHPLAWDGTTDAGGAAPDGSYQFSVQATRAGVQAAETSLAFGVVSSVTTGGNGVQLNVPSLGTVAFADVRQIL